MWLMGQYHQALDARGRVLLPDSFRKAIGATELRKGLVATRGFDRCVYLFPARAWEAVVEGFSPLLLKGRDARRLERLFLGEAEELAVDRLGRIALPDRLRARAGLGGQALFIGAAARIEIWHPARWAGLEGSMRERYEELAEAFYRFFHRRNLA